MTGRLANGLDPADLARFTLKRALLDGGGYGYWRNLYLDSDPALLIATGRLHQARPDVAWLRSVAPGLRAAAKRTPSRLSEAAPVLRLAKEEGCRKLSRAIPAALRHCVIYSVRDGRPFFNVNTPADLAEILS